MYDRAPKLNKRSAKDCKQSGKKTAKASENEPMHQTRGIKTSAIKSHGHHTKRLAPKRARNFEKAMQRENCGSDQKRVSAY